MTAKSPFTAVLVALFLGAGTSLGGCASTGEVPRGGLAQKVAEARTAADHEALAANFEREAQVMRDKAAEHERMIRTYGVGGYALADASFAQHCTALVRRYRGAADDNLALAKLHRELAAKAKP